MFTSIRLRPILAILMLLGSLPPADSFAQATVEDILGPDLSRRTISFNTMSGSFDIEARALFLLLAEKSRLEYIVAESSLTGKVNLPTSNMPLGKAFEKLLSEKALQILTDPSGTVFLISKQTERRKGTAAYADLRKVLADASGANVNIKGQGMPAAEVVGQLMSRMKLPKPTGDSPARILINVKYKPADAVLKTILEVTELNLEADDKKGSVLKSSR